MRDLLFAVDGPDLIQSLDAGRKTSVNAEDLAVDDRREAEVIEDFRAISPDGDAAIFP